MTKIHAEGATYLLTAHLVSNKYCPMTALGAWKEWANPIQSDSGCYEIRIGHLCCSKLPGGGDSRPTLSVCSIDCVKGGWVRDAANTKRAGLQPPLSAGEGSTYPCRSRTPDVPITETATMPLRHTLRHSYTFVIDNNIPTTPFDAKP